MIKECPCRHCKPPKRNATCHGTCKEYKKWMKECEKHRKETYVINNAKWLADEDTIKANIKIKRRKGR